MLIKLQNFRILKSEDTNEYDKQDLFIVDFSRNIHNITDEQDNNSDSSDNVEEIQNEENVGGRGGNKGSQTSHMGGGQ
ncbi:unnamed protein product [Rhizophagus irregularis]|nr:unnamed protein product [Rhizophagus irregularis]